MIKSHGFGTIMSGPFKGFAGYITDNGLYVTLFGKDCLVDHICMADMIDIAWGDFIVPEFTYPKHFYIETIRDFYEKKRMTEERLNEILNAKDFSHLTAMKIQGKLSSIEISIRCIKRNFRRSYTMGYIK